MMMSWLFHHHFKIIQQETLTFRKKNQTWSQDHHGVTMKSSDGDHGTTLSNSQLVLYLMNQRSEEDMTQAIILANLEICF